jgi:hypothetical protein
LTFNWKVKTAPIFRGDQLFGFQDVPAIAEVLADSHNALSLGRTRSKTRRPSRGVAQMGFSAITCFPARTASIRTAPFKSIGTAVKTASTVGSRSKL